MEYHFQDFAFNSESLTLTKQNTVIKLRHNEAKILALLIKNPKAIISKKEIFENVWVNEVVSEQPIFQNISRLRAIFGTEAIINHSKKGYQWTIPLNANNAIKPTAKNINNPTNHRRYLAFILVSLSILFFAVSTYLSHSVDPAPSSTPIDKKYNYAFTSLNSQIGSHNQSQVNALFQQFFSEYNPLDNQINEPLTYRELDANLEYVLWDRLTRYKADALVTLNLSAKYQQLLLDVQIIGKSYHWQAKLLGNNIDDLFIKLAQQLNYINSAKLFEKDHFSDKHLNAKLQLLYQQYPDDVTILSQFISNQIDVGNTSDALLLVEQLLILAKQQENIVYQAKGYWLKSKIYIQQNYLKRAQAAITQATTIYQKYNDLDSEVSLVNDRILLAHVTQDYETIDAVFSRTIELTKQIDDYKNEFWLNLYASKFALLYQQPADGRLHLSLGKALYNSRYFEPAAIIKFHTYDQMMANVKQDKAKLTAALHDILNTANQYTGLPRHYKAWAQQRLTEHYLAQNQPEQAISLFDVNAPLSSLEKSLISNVYKHWGKVTMALDVAKQAFKEATLDGDVNISLDAASILIQLTNNPTVKEHIHKELYIDYIKNNASPAWLARNQWLIKKYALNN